MLRGGAGQVRRERRNRKVRHCRSWGGRCSVKWVLDCGLLLPSVVLVRCGTKLAGTEALERGWKVPKFKEVGGEEVATLFTDRSHASRKL